jgi:hypothetical protein
MNDKEVMAISVYAEKTFDNIKHSFMMKTLNKLRIDNIIKVIYNKQTIY